MQGPGSYSQGKQAKHAEPSSGAAPAVAMTESREARKACPPGCCSGSQGQDVGFLVPLADALAPQNSLKRGTSAEANGRNVSQRSVRFSLDLQELGRSPAAANNNSATPGASCLKNSGAQPVHQYSIAIETAPSAESAFSMASVRLLLTQKQFILPFGGSTCASDCISDVPKAQLWRSECCKLAWTLP